MTEYLGGLTLIGLAERTAHKTFSDRVFGEAAELAFFFLLSLFPFLIFLVSIVGLVSAGSALQTHLVHWLTQAMPHSASDLVRNIAQQTTNRSDSGKLSFGIVFALWTASSGMVAVIDGLNVAFDIKEPRSWIKQRLTALWLTVSMGMFMLLAVAIILFGSQLATWTGGEAGVFWQVLEWCVAVFLVILAFAIVYRYAPNKKVDQSRQWITPGAVVGVLLWLAASIGFRAYLMYFGSYSATYGSLGGVIVLMLWFYVTAIAVLLGGEVDAEIEKAARHGSAQCGTFNAGSHAA
jgi:membrane protein